MALINGIHISDIQVNNMPIKYVGRTTDHVGKTLWEIVANLNNFGLGRLVYRHSFNRYPEPSFFRILKVDPVSTQDGGGLRKVRCFVERVFRGQRYPEVQVIYEASYKTDYRLIPREEEQSWWDRAAASKRPISAPPETMKFPPLLKYLVEQDLKAKGLPIPDLKIPTKLRHHNTNVYKDFVLERKKAKSEN